MKIKPALVTALCSTIFAHNAFALDELPSGWTSRQEKNLTHYQPKQLGDRVFILTALTPLPDGGMTRTAWLEKMAAELATNYGTVIEHDAVDSAGDLVLTNYRIDVKGKKLYANFTAFPAGDGKMRLVQLLSEEDVELLKRYQEDAKKIIAGLYVEGEENNNNAPSPATTAATNSTASAVQGGIAHGRAFIETFKMDGLTPGGALAFGDYQCAVQTEGGMKFTLSLYDNGQYRISGDGNSSGEYQYERDGRINIRSDRILYNFDYDGETKEIAFFFRDKDGKSGISSISANIRARRKELPPQNKALPMPQLRASNGPPRRVKACRQAISKRCCTTATTPITALDSPLKKNSASY